MLVRTAGNEPDDPRRRLLLAALAAGLFAGPAARSLAGVFGQVPAPLPAGRSIYAISGPVTIDGIAATADTPVAPGSTIRTGQGGRVTLAVGRDAFLVRPDSDITFAPAADRSGSIEQIRVASGGLLSVFGKTRHRISTPLAVIGIRGTGIYVEAEPDRSYVCTCYGTVDLAASTDPGSSETITSEHHDAPRYVLGDQAASGQRLRPAPFRNHTDDELALLEALVGRSPPFGPGADGYQGPRRDTY